MDGDDSMQTSFIDPKDMTTSFPPSPPSSSSLSQSDIASSSAPASTSTAPKKKRKSWGQVLPKPTTALPPRKRAKTSEEKQQRLYERVQRNRQAAHNSRMRKQNEMDDAISENNQLKQDNQHLQDEVARLKEEVAYWRQQKGAPAPTFDHAITPPADFLTTYPSPTAPSLTSGSSADDGASLEESLPEPSLQAYTPPTSDTKQFNDSHSAEMCSRQWTLNSLAISMEGTDSVAKT